MIAGHIAISTAWEALSIPATLEASEANLSLASMTATIARNSVVIVAAFANHNEAIATYILGLRVVTKLVVALLEFAE